MKTKEQWLEEKLKDYKKNPVSTLSDLLHNTLDVIEQYQRSPDSVACYGLLQTARECNQEFLQAITQSEKE